MDETHKLDDAAYIGPYKATRLWNDVVTAFRQYMPCGRHRRYMKTFDNCFSGSLATEWLHQYLSTNSNFGADVSREKAVSLLNKLYKAGIFDEVKLSKSMRHKQDVQENRLYKFLPPSPTKTKLFRLPLVPRNDAGVNRSQQKDGSLHQQKHAEVKQAALKGDADVPQKKQPSKLVRKISILKKEKNLKEEDRESGEVPEENYPPCHLITRILTTKEIKDTWKTVFISRLKKVLGVSSLGEIIDTDVIDGYNVMHNCIYLNKSGVVTNIDAHDHLPHWVMSAMKCLARWPEPPEPGLPSYPGFEKDVFGVVKDYFLSLEEPLVPFTLYDVITNVFVMAGNNPPRHSSPHRYENESGVPSSLWTSASLENIILNLTKKYCLLDNTGSRYGTHEDLRPTSMFSQRFGTQEDLRFAGHLDSNYTSYNRSAFPSTDGMDRLGQSKSTSRPFFEGMTYGFQESCPSLPGISARQGCKALSRTTQSAGEAYSRSDAWLSGMCRKYGSTPNLKVSRYETAFGPDNRTVTRVFYHNGMSTDYGHDDDEEEGEFCPPTTAPVDTCDQVKSADFSCVKDFDLSHRDHSPYQRPTVRRSKSSTDVTSPLQEKLRDPDFASLERPESRHNTSSTAILIKGADPSSGFHGSNNSIHRVLDCDSCSIPNRTLNSSREAFHESGMKGFKLVTPGPVVHRLKDNDESPHQTSFHSVESHHSNGSLTRMRSLPQEGYHTPPVKKSSEGQGSPSQEAGNLNSSQCQPHSSQARISVLSPPLFYANEERPSSSQIKHPPPAGNYGPGYRPVKHGQSERPASYSSTVVNTSPYLAYDCHQRQGPENDLVTPGKHMSWSASHNYGPGYRPSSENYGPGYKPVLDASKERHSVSITNLTSLQNAPPRNRIPLSHNSAANQITSTPFSPSYPGCLSSLGGYDHPRGLNFSSITPFFSTKARTGDKDHTSAFMNYPQNRLSENRAKNSLQMVSLLIPPANRRKLHLLFKMMVKMTSNPNLCLDPMQTTRSLVLSTFFPAIIRSREEYDLDELVVLQLVSFMLDFYADIFTPPTDIKTQVSERLRILQRPQVVYSPRPERTVRFCQQTSMTEFENQRMSSSQCALEELLEGIISDQNMSGKEKKKRLKQFQRTYPTIYTRRFPNPESEAAVIPQKPKMKQPLMVRPLSKLKGLRL